MRTVAAWIKAHPGVNVLAFDRNSGKGYCFGEPEEFCLALMGLKSQAAPDFLKCWCRIQVGLQRIPNELHTEV
jgi:hypothetical protein